SGHRAHRGRCRRSAHRGVRPAHGCVVRPDRRCAVLETRPTRREEPTRTRATAAGALAAMIVSSTLVVVLMATQGLFSNDPIIYGIASNVVVFVGVSLLTRKPTARVAGA